MIPNGSWVALGSTSRPSAREGEARWSRVDSRPAHIKKAAEASLKRLKVDAIDPVTK